MNNTTDQTYPQADCPTCSEPLVFTTERVAYSWYCVAENKWLHAGAAIHAGRTGVEVEAKRAENRAAYLAMPLFADQLA